MVYFKDVTISGNTYLMILDYEKQPMERGTRLRVHQSLIGSIAPDWPKFTNHLRKTIWTREIAFSKTSSAWILESSHHRSTQEASPLLTLGRRIVGGETKWGDNIEFVGEFHYFQGYWEWSEDILDRCGSELRHAGIYDSVYASLFTYDRNIEIMKAFCEAWCPSTNTLLTSFDELSISLSDLHVLFGLPAYGTFYDEMVPCTEELVGKNKEGNFYVPATYRILFNVYHLIRAQADSVTIEEWIKFSSKKNLVYQQPPPRKENKTARSQFTYNPTGNLKAHGTWTEIEKFPFTRLGIKEKHWQEAYLAAYIACWLCSFVLPDGDANLIRPNSFKMASIMANQRKVALTIPTLTSIYRGLNNISNSLELSKAFPIHFVYSWVAHYFKTHFTFERKTHISRMVQYSGEEGARQYDFIKAGKRILQGDKISWNCTMFTEEDNIQFVDNDVANDSTSSNAERHFKRQKKHAKSTEDCAESNHPNAFTSKVAKEIFGTDDLEDLQDNHDSAEFDELLEPQQSKEPIKVKPTPCLGAIFEFNGKALFDKHRKTCLHGCWSEIRDKVMRTPLDFISSIQEEVLGGFSQMKTFSSDFDMSYLESSLNKLFDNVVAYDEAKSLSFESGELSAQRLEEVKGYIRNAKTKDDGEVDQIKSIKKELAELEEHHKNLSLSLKEHQTSREAIQTEIKGFEEELVKMKNDSENEASEKVKSSKSLLESAQKVLEDQDPFASIFI